MPAEDNHNTLEPTRQCPSFWHWCLVGALILIFSAYYGWLAIRQYKAFVSSVDLANANQAVWSTVNGNPFGMTTYPTMSNRLGMHVEPILLALAPLYALFPSPQTLLLIQPLILALAAVPLYLLANEALRHPTRSLAFPLLYLLSPAIHNAAISDFHAVTLGVLPAMAALLAIWKGQTRTALACAAVALMAREDYGLWLVALAALGWWQSRKRVWIGIALIGLGWFLIAVAVIPSFLVAEQRSVFWDRYLFWLQGPEAWRTQGFLAEKGRYLIMLLLMGGAGALIAPLWALPALPALGLNLLSNYLLPVSLDAYYSVLIVPSLLAASAIGLGRLRPRWQGVALLFLLATAFWVHRGEGRSPLVPGFHPPERTAHSKALETVLTELPDDASVSATANVAPHVSGREMLRIFPYLEDCEYVAVDLLLDKSLHPLDLRQRVFDLLAAGWGIRTAEHAVLLLEKGAQQTEVPSTFYAFMTPEHSPQYSGGVMFGEAWWLEGFDVFWDYWGRPALRLYWRLQQPADGNWQPAALALDEEGGLLVTPDTHPPVALLWYPTSRWQTGKTYMVEMLPFDAPDTVSLLAGVGTPLVEAATRLNTTDGRDLVPLVTLERHHRGWRVYSNP